MMYMRINMNIPDELLKKIDEKSAELYMTRTSYFIMAVTQKLQSDEVIESLPDIKNALKQIEDKFKNK